MEVFTIKGLNFAYPEQAKNAISDLSLSIQPGEFLVLCGPSGCGKSTLLRQLKTVLAPHLLRRQTPPPQPSSVPTFPLMPRTMPERSGTWSRLWQAASRSPWRSGRRTCLACADIWSDWNERQSRRTSRRNANSCGAGFVLCRRCCMRCRKRNEQRTNREKPTRR